MTRTNGPEALAAIRPQIVAGYVQAGAPRDRAIILADCAIHAVEEAFATVERIAASAPSNRASVQITALQLIEEFARQMAEYAIEKQRANPHASFAEIDVGVGGRE